MKKVYIVPEVKISSFEVMDITCSTVPSVKSTITSVADGEGLVMSNITNVKTVTSIWD